MGYRIIYDGREGTYEVRPQGSLFPGLLAAIGILFTLGCCLWPEGLAVVQDWLVPGEDAVTVEAFRTMTDDLRSGAEMVDAVEAFCRFVIHGK